MLVATLPAVISSHPLLSSCSSGCSRTPAGIADDLRAAGHFDDVQIEAGWRRSAAIIRVAWWSSRTHRPWALRWDHIDLDQGIVHV